MIFYNFNLQDWILYCNKNENSICDDFINYDYQFYQLQSQWINNVKSYNQSFPNLYISFSTTPTGTKRNYFEENLSSLESFSYYWSTVDSCQINLSLSMKINLMSYDDVFVNKKILEVEKKLFEQKFLEIVDNVITFPIPLEITRGGIQFLQFFDP